MLKQFSEKFLDRLVKKRGSLILEPDAQNKVLSASKIVRSVDYVLNFEIDNGATTTKGVTTRANWLFILTNAAVYWENMDLSDFPKVAVKFPYYDSATPFATVPDDWGAVPSNLVFGREGLTGKMQHFEEYKNLYFLLGQRFSINLDVKAKSGQYGRGYVILSGIEINLEGA